MARNKPVKTQLPVQQAAKTHVSKGDRVLWNGETYHVILADDELFAICKEKNKVILYDNPQVFSNNPRIFSLDNIGMSIIND